MTEKTEDLIAEARRVEANIDLAGSFQAAAMIRRLADALAVLSAPQEAAPVCAWCPLPARGDAWHNDGKLHPSCGQIGHGQGWVPPYLAPVAKPCGESDDDIRGRLSELLFTIYDHGTQPNALREADAILAAFPVLSRDIAGEIEAEADESAGVMYTGGLRRAAEIVRNGR